MNDLYPQTTVTIAQDIWQQVFVEAATYGVSVQEYIERAICHELDEDALRAAQAAETER